MGRKKLSNVDKFNKKYAEYKKKIDEGEMPDAVFTTKLLLLANDVVKETDDIGGGKDEVDLKVMLGQLGTDTSGALDGINIVDKTADRDTFLANYGTALEEEKKAKMDAANLLATTVVGVVTTALKSGL